MSRNITSFADVGRALEVYWPRHMQRHHTLECMYQLLEAVGNPQNRLQQIVHVAGTSGKTSTAYYCAALLKAAGKRVGLAVSPHVDEVNERVQIDLVPLPEAQFVRRFETFLELVEQSGTTPTYFEVLIAFALWEFAAQDLDVVVIEVGHGGLLDQTNVFSQNNKLCVITDIGFDHMASLGNTLGEIATHKAGIIQLHNSVFCYRQADEVMRPIVAAVRQKQADLHLIDDDQTASLPALPSFQQRNLGLACAAVDWLLQEQYGAELTERMIAVAARTDIPARMETYSYNGKTLIVDVAHNSQKLQALMASIQQKYGSQPIAGLLGFLAGRDYRLEDSIAGIVPNLQHAIATEFGGAIDGPHHSEAAAHIAKLASAHTSQPLEIITDPERAFQALLGRPEPILLVTGSFYLLNHIRPLMKKQSDMIRI